MGAPAIFQATYSDFRLVRSRKVVQFVFEVPIEGANQACEVLGGMPNPAEETWCAIARLDLKKTNGPLFEEKAAAETKPKAPRAPVAAEKRLAQRAGILCAELSFRKFLEDETKQPIISEDAAAISLRKICGVSSRSELIIGTEEGDRFEQLLGRYEGWKAGIE